MSSIFSRANVSFSLNMHSFDEENICSEYQDSRETILVVRMKHDLILFFLLPFVVTTQNKRWLPSRETAEISHSSFCGTGCVAMCSALVSVSLMRRRHCYGATHRLLLIQVNHYCCIIALNRNSSLYKILGSCIHRPV